jgi:HK97 family phage portal protein
MQLTLLDLSEAKSNIKNLSEGPFTLADPNLVRALVGVVNAAGKPVTKDTALRCASFFSGVKMLANDVAKMPVLMFERKTVKGRLRTSKAVNDPRFALLKDVPNNWMTAFQLRWMQIFHLFFEGNSYVQKIEDQTGRLLALMPLNPWHVRKRWDRTVNPPALYFDYDDGSTKATFSQDQIWWNSILNCYGTEGTAIIALAKDALSVMMASDEVAGKYFANGLFSSGFITTDKDAEVDSIEAQNLVDKLSRFYSGSGNAGKFTFMPYGAKFEKMVFTAEEAQLLESRKWNAEEVVRLLGGAPLLVKLGYGEKNSTYAASSAFLEEYFNTSLMPLTVNIEQSIVRDLVDPADRGRFFAKYDADVALRGDMKTRFDAYAVAIDKGWMSPNDVLDEEDENTVDGLDYYHINQNAILVDGEILTVGVRAAPPGSVDNPPITEPHEPPQKPQPAALVLAAVERILRKEEKSGRVDGKFIAQVFGIAVEQTSDYVTKRAQLTRQQAQELLITIATGEQS